MTGPIYTVTVFDPSRDWQHRTWCWLPTKEEAVAVVYSGDDLLCEDGSYRYAVIEAVPSGMDWDRECWWFRFDRIPPEGYVDGALYTTVQLAEAPEEQRSICCF